MYMFSEFNILYSDTSHILLGPLLPFPERVLNTTAENKSNYNARELGK